MLLKIREGFGRWVVILILGLIAVSFIFWGVDFNLTGPSFAAEVNGEEIPLQAFEREFQAEQAEFQELYRVELDEQIRRELRQVALNRLVQREALLQRARDAGYRASDSRVIETILSSQTFQAGGEFSRDLYESLLAFQGMSPTGYEELQREQLEMLDLQLGIMNSAFVTPWEYQRYIELALQRRELAYAAFEAAAFVDRVEIAEDGIAAHYEDNPDRYMTEEAAAIEYLEITRDAIAEQIDVSEEDLRAYYERQRELYEQQEERRASHILLTAAEDESDGDVQARAEALRERIESGEDFESLAAEHSDDTGTAGVGGDLGWISRGMLEGPFEDALYALEAGEVSQPVRTDFGYHLIRLDDIRAADEQAFEEVRDELLTEYRTTLADDLFFERGNELADVAFEQYDDLASVAERLDLELQRVERYLRSGDPSLFPSNAEVINVVFGGAALETGINSEVLQLTDDHVVVVRVVERFPPELRPLEEVAEQIRETLTLERADELAAAAAAAFAEALPEQPDAEFLGVAADDGDASGASGEDDGASTAAGDNGGTDETGSDSTATAEDGDSDGEGAEGDSTAADAEGGNGTAEDPAAAPASPVAQLVAEHNGVWHPARWIRRDDANAPSEILTTAFDLPPPEEGEHSRRAVNLLAGGRALVFVFGVQPGDPIAVAVEEREALRRQMLESTANAELSNYAGAVREQARVTIPPQVLDPEF